MPFGSRAARFFGSAFGWEKRERLDMAVKAAALAFIPVMPSAFKSSPPETRPATEGSLLAGLEDRSEWEAVVEEVARRLPRRRERIAEYRALLDEGAHRALAASVLAGRHRFAPPLRREVNRDGGTRRKTVFSFGARDELLLRVVGRLLRSPVESLHADVCHSFRRGRGARTALRALLRDRSLERKACLRVDIVDYFNSIPVERLLDRVPSTLMADGPVRALMEGLLLDRRARVGERVVDCDQRGVMAGTPLAPMLSNLYLRDIDLHFAAAGVTYARYSDDLAIFDVPLALDEHRGWLEAQLTALGLAINPAKSCWVAPGEPWEFLGLRHHAGRVDVAPHSRRKLSRRLRRLARVYERGRRRRGWSETDAVRRYLRRVNRKLYGIELDANDLCWTRCFFPVLTEIDSLSALDRFVQEKARYVATGRHRSADRARWPYSRLRELGFVSLTTAYRAHRRSPERYQRFLVQRLGCAPSP